MEYHVIIDRGIIHTAGTKAECEKFISDRRNTDQVFDLLEKEHGQAQIMSDTEYQNRYSLFDLLD